MITAAAPRPAPRPAARPTLLEPPLSLAVMSGPPVADADAAAWVPDIVSDPVCALLPPSEVDVDVAELVVVVSSLLPVVVPSVFNGCSVKGAEVLVIPGQLVLPITVTVLGWLSPNFTANLPVSQSQFGSPGQQYQSCSVLHFPRGMEVFESEEIRQRFERDLKRLALTLSETPARTLLTIPCPVCTCASVVIPIAFLFDVADTV